MSSGSRFSRALNPTMTTGVQLPKTEPDAGGLTSLTYYNGPRVVVYTVDQWKVIYWMYYLRITRAENFDVMTSQVGWYQQAGKQWPLYRVECTRLTPLPKRDWKRIRSITKTGIPGWDFVFTEHTTIPEYQWVHRLRTFLLHWGRANFVPDIKASNFMKMGPYQHALIWAVDPFVHVDIWDAFMGQEGVEWRVRNAEKSAMVIPAPNTP